MIKSQDQVIVPLFQKAVTTGEAVSGSVNCDGYDDVTIVVSVVPTTTTNGVSTLGFADSDDNTTFVTVVANQSVVANTNAATAAVVCRIPPGVNRDKYVKATLTQGTVTNCTGNVSGIAILSRPGQSPQTTSDIVAGIVGTDSDTLVKAVVTASN